MRSRAKATVNLTERSHPHLSVFRHKASTYPQICCLGLVREGIYDAILFNEIDYMNLQWGSVDRSTCTGKGWLEFRIGHWEHNSEDSILISVIDLLTVSWRLFAYVTHYSNYSLRAILDSLDLCSWKLFVLFSFIFTLKLNLDIWLTGLTKNVCIDWHLFHV